MKRSNTRYGVVGFCFVLAMITYIDRACIGVLASAIRSDLGLSMTQMGYVFSAFAISYGLFEIPSAWWGEKIGARLVLARIVMVWSVFTMLTAAATGYFSLLVIRFLFGAGEAGAWPNITRVFSRWIPVTERGRVQGIFFSGAHLAAGLTPPLVLLLLQFVGWRSVFLIFGSLGFLWTLAWLRWFRDKPGDHPGVNEAELSHINGGIGQESSGHHLTVDRAMMKSILTNYNVYLLCIVAFANGYGAYFPMTWLPTYLQTLGFSAVAAAIYSGLPMLFAVPADLLGGVTSDYLSRRFGLRFGRALVGGTAYAVAAGTMFAATRYTENPHLTAILLAATLGASMFALASSWASIIDVGTAQSGMASAIMNTVGCCGGILSPMVMAWLVQRSGVAANWEGPLLVIAGLYSAAALCWLFINPTKRSRV